MHIPKLIEKNKFKTIENFSYLFIVIGATMLSVGILLTIINPHGISAVIALSGSFIAFISTIILIFNWLLKELFGE
jgi:hypothetical protein